MKNITVSVADELYEQSRVIAAQRETTVTGLVREYLQGLSDAEQRREQARGEILKMIGSFNGKIGRMPTREERNARRLGTIGQQRLALCVVRRPGGTP